MTALATHAIAALGTAALLAYAVACAVFILAFIVWASTYVIEWTRRGIARLGPDRLRAIAYVAAGAAGAFLLAFSWGWTK